MAVLSLANLGKWGYASGAADGTVRIWSTELKQLFVINLLRFSPVPIDMKVSVLQSNIAHSKIAIGMSSGEVYELAPLSRSSQIVIQGHGSLQLHGLSVCPTNEDEFATAGDDGSVMVWSIERSTCIRRTAIDVASRAIAWSHDGTKLVVGIGGSSSLSSKDGAFMILEAANLQIIFEDRKSKRAISDAIWSGGNNSIIVLSSADGKVYIHDPVTYDLRRAISVPGDSVIIKRIEVSTDGSYIRIGTGTGLFDVKTIDGSLTSDPRNTQDVEWSSYNSTYNWLTQGV